MGKDVCFIFRRTISVESIQRAMKNMVPRLDTAERIHLVLNSPGGSLSAALPFAEFLKTIGHVSTYNVGLVNSAAIPIFAVGDERICSAGASFKLHDVMGCASGYHTLSEFEKIVETLRNDRMRMVELLETQTGSLASVWLGFMQEGKVMDAGMAMRLGLATQTGECSMVAREGVAI